MLLAQLQEGGRALGVRLALKAMGLCEEELEASSSVALLVRDKLTSEENVPQF